MGTLIFIQQRYKIYSFPTASLDYFVLLVYLLTGIYWYLLRKIKNLALFAYLQISIDILLVSILVHITGGIDSVFSPLYHLVIISGSIILYRPRRLSCRFDREHFLRRHARHAVL